MSLVDIEDFECPCCRKLTTAVLNIKAGTYTCLRCDKEFKGDPR